MITAHEVTQFIFRSSNTLFYFFSFNLKPDWSSIGLSKEFQVKGVSKSVSRKLQVCFNEVTGVFQGSKKGISRAYAQFRNFFAKNCTFFVQNCS